MQKNRKKHKKICWLIGIVLISMVIPCGWSYAETTSEALNETQVNPAPRISHLENNKIKTTDLYNGERTFSILGMNFHHNIKNVQLIPYSGKAWQTIDINTSDVERISTEKIDVHIRGEKNSPREKLSNEENTGTYEVKITFDDTPLTIIDKEYETVISSVYDEDGNRVREDATFLHILSKGAPELKSKYPSSENGLPWHDEKGLIHDKVDNVTKDRYFLKAVFYDADGKLELGNLEDLKNCIIRTSGGTGNLVDIQWIDEILKENDEAVKTYKDNYFFVKNNQEAVLYIPIKDLRAQTSYQVILPPSMVYYTDTYVGNDNIEWTFTTTSIPQIQQISLGTVPEDYDEDEALYIKGDFFDTRGDVKVYFNDIEAEDVNVVSKNLLEVYLPSGRDRLEPGTYDVLVENDQNHKKTTHGSLSVIQGGEFVPNETYRIKDDSRQGEVRGLLKRSEDTLLLSPDDIDEKELFIDLDKIMGEDVYIRKIQYEGNERYKIGMLKTASKWADITIYGLTLDDDAEEDEMTLSIGRTEIMVARTLKEKLRGRGILSEFIQISGENFKMDRARISIPLKYGSAKRVKILRYDEATRSFYEQQGTVNLVDGKVEMFSPVKGIFVAVNQ
ncbi:IPT/TIG domain-containing protein [Clostridiaceae bacterium 35-E11]